MGKANENALDVLVAFPKALQDIFDKAENAIQDLLSGKITPSAANKKAKAIGRELRTWEEELRKLARKGSWPVAVPDGSQRAATGEGGPFRESE